jgi:hypothetical protein
VVKLARCLPSVIAITLLVAIGSVGRISASTGSDPSPSPATTYHPAIDPNDFTTTINNPYFPLIPGTTYIYEGSEDGDKTRDEVKVTTSTKEVLGVTCVDVLDRVYTNGELSEKTHDWYAQDKTGNIWYFGEASSTIEEGTPTSSEGSWKAGVDGAQPGIIMPANPHVGDTYRQEYYAGVAEDMAEVTAISGTIDVPYGHLKQILVTREWSPLEPKVEEEKTYAKGVGDVRERTTMGGNEKLELVEVRKSSAASPVATPTS